MSSNAMKLDQQLLSQLLDDEKERAQENQSHLHLSDSDKVAFLLNALDFHMSEIQRREEKEQTLFEWCTNLLLITFGAVIALSGQSNFTSFAVGAKIIASLLIGVPIIIFIYRILIQRSRAKQNAQIADHIRDIFHAYDESHYSKQALYPKLWKGGLAKVIVQRRTPLYFSGVLIFMASCVIVAIWTFL